MSNQDDKQARIDSYKAKQEARIDRLKERAERARKESEQRQKAARQIIEHIPMGQPILVGHHSERHHRADLKRHDNHMRKAIEASETADALERAINAAENNHAISSDDPEAIEKLTARLQKREAMQALMKKANAAIRLKDAAAGDEKLRQMGFTDTRIHQLRQPDFCGRIGFPDYALSNNNADIRRIKERVKQLQAKEEARQRTQAEGTPNKTEHHTRAGLVTLIENHEENRLQLVFPGKPDEATRTLLKSYGFRWAPTARAWQRQLNNNAKYYAQLVLQKLSQ